MTKGKRAAKLETTVETLGAMLSKQSVRTDAMQKALDAQGPEALVNVVRRSTPFGTFVVDWWLTGKRVMTEEQARTFATTYAKNELDPDAFVRRVMLRDGGEAALVLMGRGPSHMRDFAMLLVVHDGQPTVTEDSLDAADYHRNEVRS